MPKVTIDGVTVEVEPGTTILNAARKIGGDLVPPAMCYYSKLNGSGGKCRVCLVEITKASEANPNPIPKLQASCCTPVADGMEVKNMTSPKVQDMRKGVVEFLLINHPLDCPICDQAGECDLQNLGYNYGVATTRYGEERRTFERIDIGDKIQLHMNRCILCYRCTYVADQLTDHRCHGVINRGDAAEISTYIQNAITNEMSGNMIDVCPVGALTDKTFRFKSRVWFLKPYDAHRECDKCCGKAVVWMFGKEIYRVTVRKDEYHEVESDENGKPMWICNTCRYEKKDPADWVIEGVRKHEKWSVINQGKYMKGTEKVVIDADPRLFFGRPEDRKRISMNGTVTPEQTLSDGK
ncbi:MAG: 2Fe-2S iron-sulfur cluster-binding protein [Chitinophagales bacterium]|nr:2Fe-2S iron-sulfur cluster-binding protein [Chitinophagales bacterium]MDW8419634.1 2Fe-2S iron-sulfur cluster-binding protein [Chitinophagales bacterium]